jgi:hypothetical protein
MRRLWSKDNFKSAVSPHEFLQAVSLASDKKFRVGQQAECIDFMVDYAYTTYIAHNAVAAALIQIERLLLYTACSCSASMLQHDLLMVPSIL